MLYYYQNIPAPPDSTLGTCVGDWTSSSIEGGLGHMTCLVNKMWVGSGDAAVSRSLRAMLWFCLLSALCHETSKSQTGTAPLVWTWVGRMNGVVWGWVRELWKNLQQPVETNKQSVNLCESLRLPGWLILQHRWAKTASYYSFSLVLVKY